MSLQSHFNQFLTIENFILAYNRLQTSSRNLYKELYHEDLKIFGLFLEQNIKALINEIEQEIFSAESSYKIFVPKKNNLVRPLSLLKFKDLLVYQAIINTISENVWDDIFHYYNNVVFGNIYTTSKDSEKDRKFFFKPWKQQWKRFEQRTINYYENGYKYLTEFDIASFFDMIDHHILSQILEAKYKINQKLINLLLKLLEAFTKDSNHSTYNSKHGIPQGPIGSSFLGDIYLFHLDQEIKNNKSLDIKYIRYVDDIRVFSKDNITGKKAVAYLDLLSRDLGLIPQVNKILVREIQSKDELIKNQKNGFSKIALEYKAKEGSLKSKTHRNLKKNFLKCFDKANNEYLDKTIISFSLYKLNKDEEIKLKIIERIEDLYIHFEAILYYFKKHFKDDDEIITFLMDILIDENLLFHYIAALILKVFPEIVFIPEVYDKYFRKKQRHWIVQYFMINWLYQNKKFEIINSLDSENYFLMREINNFKFKIINDEEYSKIFINELLVNKDCLVALQGVYLDPFIISRDSLDITNSNEYVRYIISQDTNNYINYTLMHSFSIQSSQLFFDINFWDNNKFKELIMCFRLFFQYRNIDPSKSLLNLNLFNELIYEKLCQIFNINLPEKCTYGDNLNNNYIEIFLPITNRCFTIINKERNQRTDAHLYDKEGNIRERIDRHELEKLVSKQVKALDEICSFDFQPHLLVNS